MALSEKSRQKLIKKGGSAGMSLLRFVLLAGISFVILYPLVTKILVSFMPVSDVYDMSVHYIPKTFTLSNYQKAWDFLNIPALAFNSFFYPLVVSLIQTVSATVVAYGFARFDFRFKGFFFFLVVLGMVVPPDLILLPLYVNFRYFDVAGLFQLIFGRPLNLLDTVTPFALLGITCTGLKNGLYIFMMRQYFRGLPKELEEAAYVDGAGYFTTMVRIILPMAKPSIITVILFEFLAYWNEYIISMTMLTDPNGARTLPVGLLNLMKAQNAKAEYGQMYAGMVMVMVPTLILYMCVQKKLTQGMTIGGIKG